MAALQHQQYGACAACKDVEVLSDCGKCGRWACTFCYDQMRCCDVSDAVPVHVDDSPRCSVPIATPRDGVGGAVVALKEASR